MCHARITSTPASTWTTVILLILTMLVPLADTRGAELQGKRSEGMIGWWFYTGDLMEPTDFTDDPGTACMQTAQNHFGVSLLDMYPVDSSHPMYDCVYENPIIGHRVFHYGTTHLKCEPDYEPRWPGICVKKPEISRPVSCTPQKPGFAKGNPIVISSGAKVQIETDLQGGPDRGLEILRTYRTMRDTGLGQSAGSGWSFSFDRSFSANFSSGVAAPTAVKIVRGDGSYSEFSYRKDRKVYVSKFEPGETLQSLNDDFSDWAFTTTDGEIDRFRRSGDSFLLVSLHRKEGYGQLYEYDADNRLTTISDIHGRSIKVSWDADVVASVKSAEEEIKYQYDSVLDKNGSKLPGTNRLTGVAFFDMNGRPAGSRAYHYEHDGQRYLLTGITDENGIRFATFAYNQMGLAILSEHLGGVDRHTFAYPDQGKRIVTDPLGTERTYGITYAGPRFPGRVVSQSQPAGAGCGAALSEMTYDSTGTVSSSIDFGGKKICSINDAARGLETSRIEGLKDRAACPTSASAAIPTGTRRISTKWHPDWRIATAIAMPNEITLYIYNGQPNRDGSIANCLPNSAQLPDGKPIAVVCEKLVQPTTDSSGEKGFAAQIEGVPRTWKYSYNILGQLIRSEGPSNAEGKRETIENEYYADSASTHSKGDLATTKDSSGRETKFLEYSPRGRPTLIRQPDALSKIVTYTVRGKVASTTLDDGHGYSEITTYSYDPHGQLLRVIAPNGATMSFVYDDVHRLTGLSDGAGSQIRLILDKAGNVTRSEIYQANGELVPRLNYSYDALGRLQAIKRDSQVNPTVFEYNASGKLTRLRDMWDRSAIRKYDQFDRLTTEILPVPTSGALSPEIKYSYDLNHNLVGVTDPRHQTTRYKLDGFGQTIQLDSPDTGTTQFLFDNVGNLTSRQDARGSITRYRYDAAGQLTHEGNSAFKYGSNGTSTAGRLTLMSYDSGNSMFSYDSFGRLTKMTQTTEAGDSLRELSIQYEYGEQGASKGLVTSITYPSGNRIAIEYNAAGQPKSMQLHQKGTVNIRPILSEIKYRAFSSPYEWLWGNSTSHAPNLYRKTFDAVGRLETYPVGHPSHLGTVRHLQYDETDHVRAITHTGSTNAESLNQRFAYDGLDRLVQVQGDAISQSFDYDLNGNRTKTTFGTKTYDYSISQTSNRLNKTSGPNPSKQNEYDKSNNIVSDGNIRYFHDEKGRLRYSEGINGKTTYFYNGLNQRIIKKHADGLLTYYIFDPSGLLLGEYNSAGEAIQETVYLGKTPVAILKPNPARLETKLGENPMLFYVYADHLDTARTITQASDNRMVWRWDATDPFGMQSPNERPEGLPAFIYNLRFPGQIFDQETNNIYNYKRYYDPQTARYIESDPIGLLGGLNPYTYANNDPILNTDPTGEAPTKIAIWLVKVCKTGIKKIRRVSYEEGVSLAKKGENLQSTKDISKKLSIASSEGRGPIKDLVHPDPETGSTVGRRPHYHTNPRNGGHIFYSIAAAMTVAGHVDCDDCWYSYLAEGIDFFNPASLPKDIMDLTGNGDEN